MRTHRTLPSFSLSLLCAAALCACGGGGSSADPAPVTSTDTATGYSANATQISDAATEALDTSVQTAQAIIATQASDSELVIELINQAQIFRFLNKPVNVKVLRGHVHAALARYLSYQATPVLVQAQKVEVVAAAPEVQTATLGQKLFEGFKTLRMRWQR